MKRHEHLRQAARELARYIAQHPGYDERLRWRIMVLTGGGNGYTDHEIDFLERAVRKLNRSGAAKESE